MMFVCDGAKLEWNVCDLNTLFNIYK
jgi:hypothetical protein